LIPAAEVLGVSASTLKRLIGTKQIKVIRLGTGRGRVLVPDSEIQRLTAGK
jgi:excisionase family DNA binding protein